MPSAPITSALRHMELGAERDQETSLREIGSARVSELASNLDRLHFTVQMSVHTQTNQQFHAPRGYTGTATPEHAKMSGRDSTACTHADTMFRLDVFERLSNSIVEPVRHAVRIAPPPCPDAMRCIRRPVRSIIALPTAATLHGMPSSLMS